MPAEQRPEGHPISEELAKRLLAGDLGDVFRRILCESSAPIYWHSAWANGSRKIHSNGTVSFAKIGGSQFGITAAHVIRGYMTDAAAGQCILQIGNAAYDLDIIAMDEAADIALLNITKLSAENLGRNICPIEVISAMQIPQEGRGIMLSGYPGEDWSYVGPREVCWGLVTALGTARTINHDQISWKPDREQNIVVNGIATLPENKDLGGISGGPLIAWFERSGISYPVLAGIVSEAHAAFDYVIARRLDTPLVKTMLTRVPWP